MFETNLSGNNKISGRHKRNLRDTAPECPTVATGLNSHSKRFSVMQSCNERVKVEVDSKCFSVLQSCNERVKVEVDSKCFSVPQSCNERAEVEVDSKCFSVLQS